MSCSIYNVYMFLRTVMLICHNAVLVLYNVLVLVPYRCFSVIVISETICISFDFFRCVLYYIKLHYITLSYFQVYASLLSLLQLFFCLHVRLLYVIKYYLLTYLLTC